MAFAARPGNGQEVRLEVRDTGPGIPEELRQKVFEPFFTTKETGTGLGLSIVHAMLQRLRGSVSLASGPAGATFLIDLPLRGDAP